MLLWFEAISDGRDSVHSRVHEVGVPHLRARLLCDRAISVTLSAQARSPIGSSSGQIRPGRELVIGPGDWFEAEGWRYYVRSANPQNVRDLPRKVGACRHQAWVAKLTLDDGQTRLLNGKPVHLYGVVFRKASDGRRVVVERNGRPIQTRGQWVRTDLARFGDRSTLLIDGQSVTITFHDPDGE